MWKVAREIFEPGKTDRAAVPAYRTVWHLPINEKVFIRNAPSIDGACPNPSIV
jgi:hypothetical protein